MSIFGKIMGSIFGTSAHADPLPPGATPTSPTGAPPAASAATGSAMPGSATPAAGAVAAVDVAAVMDKLADASDEDLDWRKSIVDLMKLLNLDSGLAARKELATELEYTGDMKDSATMNVWLHKQVMTKLAQNGGNVPADLKH